MIIQHLLDWRAINLISPFAGIAACAYLLFSNKTCTRRKAISTALTLAIVAWLMAIWADWGSAVFKPSYQSMLFRVLLLFVSAFIMFELRRVTSANRFIVAKNKILLADNAILCKQLANPPKKRRKQPTRPYYEYTENCYYRRAKAKRRCNQKNRHC